MTASPRHAAIDRVKGWCPGALRPMRTGDGLLVRLRLSGGRITAATARAVASLARTHGNGLVDHSQRANWQIRGVTDTSWPALIEALSDLGLLDADAETEARRNVIGSPLAGLDPTAPVDGAGLVAALETGLAASDRPLPGKFGFLVDEGGAVSLACVAADIRLVGLLKDGRPMVAVAPATGGPEFHAGPEAHFAALVEPSGAADAALRLSDAFLRLARPGERRMRDVTARLGAHALLAEAGFPAVVARRAPGLSDDDLLGAPDRLGVLSSPRTEAGSGPETSSGARLIGAGAPFGRFDAEAIERLAGVAEQYGAGELRLTAWRSVLLPGIRPDAVASALGDLRAASLVVSAEDPRRAVVVCAGAPACASAMAPAREDAERLAGLAAALPGTGVRLHVSGCAKGCARPEATAVTLVGARSGPRHYDLVLAGRADDAPLATGLDLAAAAERLAALGARRADVSAASADTERASGQPGRAAATTLDAAGAAVGEGAAGPDHPPGDRMPATRDAYIKDGASIYVQSFAIIRREAALTRFLPEEEPVAVRIIHACGMVEVAADIAFSPGAVLAARAALRAGAPILCDAKMVAHGVTKARLPAGNEVLCTLDDPRVPALAAAIGNTRSAAAMELWRDRIGGSLVAIGNAPTALFRLLELLDEGVPAPAAVIGMPVGFVGAAESKAALIADGRVPYLVVTGRKGGSAMTVATINAVASERE
jgi:precorrin-8X/cobalt-precorrin-8 methylmutase